MAFTMGRAVVTYFMAVSLSSTLVLSLSLCNSTSKYLEVKEGKSDNNFTCTGLKPRDFVRWILKNGTSQMMCPASSSSRFSSCPTTFSTDMISDTANIIIINAKEYSDPNYLGTATLTCQAFTTNTSCQLDLVYPAENSSCQVEFQDNKVTALCSVSKVRSARNNYRCSLYQALKASQGRFVGSYDMKVLQEPSGYFSGTCNMSSYLPPEGRYSYYVIIMPGEVNVSATFIGNSIISRPRGILYHNCPLYLNEGDNLNCSCFVSDFGNPPGILRWNNTNSNRLELRYLLKSQNGIQSVCSLMWNNTVHQSVFYTLIVAYQPTWMSFTIDNEKSEEVFVDEKSPVTIKCQADGRPVPRMTFTKVRDNSFLKTVSMGHIIVKDQRGEIIHTLAAVQCSDTDRYRCTAANSLGMKEQSISLSVKCKPKMVGANPRTLSIFEGKTSSFELIAYPNFVKVTKYYIGLNNNNNDILASDDIFRVDCTSNYQQLHKVTCTVTVIKVTVNTAGLYKAVVSNDLGSVELIFEALPTNTTESEKSELSGGHKAGLGTGLGVGLGLAAAEAVVFTTVVLVLWWRRNHHTPKAKGGRENTRYSLRQDILLDKAVELTVSAGWEHESTYENVGKGETGQTAIYTNVEISNLTSKKTSKNKGKLYDNLHLKDVGASSPYDNLTTLNIAKRYH